MGSVGDTSLSHNNNVSECKQCIACSRHIVQSRDCLHSCRVVCEVFPQGRTVVSCCFHFKVARVTERQVNDRTYGDVKLIHNIICMPITPDHLSLK